MIVIAICGLSCFEVMEGKNLHICGFVDIHI